MTSARSWARVPSQVSSPAEPRYGTGTGSRPGKEPIAKSGVKHKATRTKNTNMPSAELRDCRPTGVQESQGGWWQPHMRRAASLPPHLRCLFECYVVALCRNLTCEWLHQKRLEYLRYCRPTWRPGVTRGGGGQPHPQGSQPTTTCEKPALYGGPAPEPAM